MVEYLKYIDASQTGSKQKTNGIIKMTKRNSDLSQFNKWY